MASKKAPVWTQRLIPILVISLAGLLLPERVVEVLKGVAASMGFYPAS